MAYYIINGYTGDLHSQWNEEHDAEKTLHRLNRECDEEFMIYNEEEWVEYMEDLANEKIANAPVYAVYGVGKHSDNYPPMEELIIAEKPSEARKYFEAKHPEYRAVSAYQIS